MNLITSIEYSQEDYNYLLNLEDDAEVFDDIMNKFSLVIKLTRKRKPFEDNEFNQIKTSIFYLMKALKYCYTLEDNELHIFNSKDLVNYKKLIENLNIGIEIINDCSQENFKNKNHQIFKAIKYIFNYFKKIEEKVTDIHLASIQGFIDSNI